MDTSKIRYSWCVDPSRADGNKVKYFYLSFSPSYYPSDISTACTDSYSSLPEDKCLKCEDAYWDKEWEGSTGACLSKMFDS